MKLTKLERHMAYMIMLAEAEDVLSEFDGDDLPERKYYGLCSVIKILFGINDNFEANANGIYKWAYNMKYFRELRVKKPTDVTRDDDNWFRLDADGWQSRISLLKQCIEETADAWPK